MAASTEDSTLRAPGMRLATIGGVPVYIGKSWPVRTNNINSANGNVWKRSGTSKIVGQESVTTKAGIITHALYVVDELLGFI